MFDELKNTETTVVKSMKVKKRWTQKVQLEVKEHPPH